FTVPADYFSESQTAILNRAIPDQAAPPIRKMAPRRWLQYAAAACVAVALSVTGYFRLADQQENDHLEAVSDQEILSYLELYGEPADITYITEYFNDGEPDIADELNELSDED